MHYTREEPLEERYGGEEGEVEGKDIVEKKNPFVLARVYVTRLVVARIFSLIAPIS